MDNAEKDKLVVKQIAEVEQYLEKVKAEMYATVGRLATLKEFLAESNKAIEPKKENA